MLHKIYTINEQGKEWYKKSKHLVEDKRMVRYPIFTIILALGLLALSLAFFGQSPASAAEHDHARVQLAHLAPFASGQDSSVTVSINGEEALTNFVFGDSTSYITFTAGTYLVEIFPTGSMTPAITATLELEVGVDYTAVAIGDGTNQPLELLALVDDNTDPAEGFFRLRLGHLAPFAADLDETRADIRLQDGSPVLENVPFGITSTIELEAGEYDLKITTPGGETTLIDPLPVTFNAGDIVSAFAVGEGMNQPLGVFALPADTPGFLLPLAEEDVETVIYLPLIFKSAAPAPAPLRVVHASPDAPAVDVWLNGSLAISNLAFGEATEFAKPGSRIL
jgi:hypothetical protein